MKKTVSPNSPEFRDLVANLSTELNLPLIPIENMGFTGHKDTDILVLMQLDDKELASICSVNKYINSLCDSEQFWLNRILLNLKKSCEYASKITFFKDINCNEFEGNLVQVKNYFGYTHYRDLNTYLNKFTKGEQLSIFLFIIHAEDEPYFEILLEKLYIIDRNILPDFVNYGKLISYLRRGFVLQFYHLEPGKNYYNQDIKFPGLEIKPLKQRRNLPEDEKRLRNINF
jgi:hypothetical protein